MKIGWAGNAAYPVKALREVLEPACNGSFDLALADGSMAHSAMNRFYNGIDVLAVTSKPAGVDPWRSLPRITT
jgi:hypothetical protein